MTKWNCLTKSLVSLVGVAFILLAVFFRPTTAFEYNGIYTPTSGVFTVYKQPTTTGCNGFEQSQSAGGTVPIRVVAPAASGTYPVLLFSHGMNGLNTQQAWLADYLARYGYIILSMEHTASDSCAHLTFPLDDSVFTARSNNVNTVLNHLDDIESRLNSSSDWTYTFDRAHIGFVGYSLGAETGLMKMPALYKLGSGPVNYGDARLKAFFLMAGNLGDNMQHPQTPQGLDQSPANLALLTSPMFWVSGGADTAMHAKWSWDLELAAPPGNYYEHAPAMDHFSYLPSGDTKFRTSLDQFACAFFDSKLMDSTFFRHASALAALTNATAYSGNLLKNTYELVSNNSPTTPKWYGSPLTVNGNYVGYATHTTAQD